jgi:hypothetical protein
MSKVTIASLVPSFDNSARAIVTAQKAFDKVAVKASAAIVQAMQMHLDACSVASVPRDLPGVNALGKGIRECQVFLDSVALGLFEKKTITEYAQSAMRAYYHNVPFSPALKNDPEMKIPAKDGSVKAAGSVKTTSNEALYKTLQKAIEQCRILGNDDKAADLLDFCLDNFEGFTETESV